MGWFVQNLQPLSLFSYILTIFAVKLFYGLFQFLIKDVKMWRTDIYFYDVFVISLSAPVMQGGRGGGSYYRRDQHLTLMILFHASSDGKTQGILEEVKITQLNLGDISINRVLRGLIFPDSGERIIPSHVTLE